MRGTGLLTGGTSAGAAECTTVRAERRGPSTAIAELLEDTLNPAVRAARARGLSAATTMADRHGAIRHAEVRVSVAAEHLAAVVAAAGVTSRRIFISRVDLEI